MMTNAAHAGCCAAHAGRSRGSQNQGQQLFAQERADTQQEACGHDPRGEKAGEHHPGYRRQRDSGA